MAQRTSVPASDFIIVQKSRKFGSLGRKNFFPRQGEKINENILNFLSKYLVESQGDRHGVSEEKFVPCPGKIIFLARAQKFQQDDAKS